MKLCTTKECAAEYHMSEQLARQRFREIDTLIKNGTYRCSYQQKPTLILGDKKRRGLVNDVVFGYHEMHRAELLRCGRKKPIEWGDMT